MEEEEGEEREEEDITEGSCLDARVFARGTSTERLTVEIYEIKWREFSGRHSYCSEHCTHILRHVDIDIYYQCIYLRTDGRFVENK